MPGDREQDQPAHAMLFLKLAKAGPVVLSGGLYHYPEERTLNRLPVAEFKQRVDFRVESGAGGFLAVVAPARLARQRQAQEGAGVLRVSARASWAKS